MLWYRNGWSLGGLSREEGEAVSNLLGYEPWKLMLTAFFAGVAVVSGLSALVVWALLHFREMIR